MTHEAAEAPTQAGPAHQRDDQAPTLPGQDVRDALPSAAAKAPDADGAEAGGSTNGTAAAPAAGDPDAPEISAARPAEPTVDAHGAESPEIGGSATAVLSGPQDGAAPVASVDSAPTDGLELTTSAPEGEDGPARRPRRMWRWLRWPVAVVVFAGLGSGVAYGVSSLERSDVPGLATRSDGRWDYPRLSLPALPAGSPRPFSQGNAAEIHSADLRRLLLPAPSGATVDAKLNGGWASTQQYLSEYTAGGRTVLGLPLVNLGLRHIAARGWTMPDGTATRLYLLQFESSGTAEQFYDLIGPGLDVGAAAPSGADTTQLDLSWTTTGGTPKVNTVAYVEPAPFGATQKRLAYIQAGDTLALVVEERKGSAPAVPFHQTLALQEELLG